MVVGIFLLDISVVLAFGILDIGSSGIFLLGAISGHRVEYLLIGLG